MTPRCQLSIARTGIVLVASPLGSGCHHIGIVAPAGTDEPPTPIGNGSLGRRGGFDHGGTRGTRQSRVAPPKGRHLAISRTWAWAQSVQTRGCRPEVAAAFPSVMGGPSSDFTVADTDPWSAVRNAFAAAMARVWAHSERRAAAHYVVLDNPSKRQL